MYFLIMLDSFNLYFYLDKNMGCNNVLTIYLSFRIHTIFACHDIRVCIENICMYSLYYCVYSTIEIALSARSSKYNTYSKYILSLHITPNVSFYYKYLYCNCLEILKNRFEIYSCFSISS